MEAREKLHWHLKETGVSMTQDLFLAQGSLISPHALIYNFSISYGSGDAG